MNNKAMKPLLTILLALFMAMTAVAQANRIYIEDFEIYPDSVATVGVLLSSTDETRGMQFNMTLPQGLRVADYELSEMAEDMGMYLTLSGDKQNRNYTVVIIPHSIVCFEPGQFSVMTLTIAASREFKGGEIEFWKVRGSTMENKSIVMDDAMTRVSVPESALIGIPIDMQQAGDQMFQSNDHPF